MDNLNYDQKKIKIVDIDSVRPNSWNPKVKDTEEYQQVLESIRENGLRETIKVREKLGATDMDLYEILDGEQRWTACKELGYTKVIIYNEGVVDDKKAREDTLWWQTQVPVDEVQLSELLAGLVKEYGEAVKVPYTEEQMQNYLKLADFDWDAYNSQKPPDDEAGGGKTIKVTDDQYAVISDAIDKVKTDSDEKKISDGRALELICGDYLSGPDSTLAGAVSETFEDDFTTEEQPTEEYQH